MTIAAALLALDAEIELLQSKVDQKRPENTLEVFARLRALSLGRSFLRLQPSSPEPDWATLDASYAAARKKLFS